MRSEPMHLRRVDDGLDHSAVGRGGAEDQVGHDAVERGARRLAAMFSLQGRVDGERDRLEHRHGDFGEPAPPHLLLRQPREPGRREPVEVDRHDHRARLVGNEAGAVIDLHQAAGDGETSFGEDDQRLAALHRVDQRARRHRLCRVERHGAREPQERPHPPALGDVVVDGEHGIIRNERQRQRRVEEADVVQRDDRVRSRLGEVLARLSPPADRRRGK